MVITNYLLFSHLLFFIGLVGIILNRNNIIMLLLCIELLLLGVNTNFIVFTHALNIVEGQVMVFFILVVAAVEATIGLAILIKIYRKNKSININFISELKG